MAIVLYKPGNTHLVRGVKCIAERFNATEDINLLKKDGWATSPEDCYGLQDETKEEKKQIEEQEEEILREDLEKEYRSLGGRVSDDWTDEDLIKRIAKKKAN